MFAHQVIEDMGKWVSFLNKRGLQDPRKKEHADDYINMIEIFLEEVRFANHFHFGDIGDILNTTNKFEGEDDLFFYNKIGPEFKTPYKYMWCDYTDKVNGFKYGGLVSMRGSEEHTYTQYDLFSFLYFTHELDLFKGWRMIEHIANFRDGKYRGECSRWTANHKKDEEKLSGYSIVKSIAILIKRSMILLNCKNITAEKIPAPEALNKKRRKAGKQELFDYHVLNVVVPSKKRGYHESTEPLSHNRVHLCRGHFKEYTVEHPLFGHYTGLFWWQPHVRGQNKDGIVMKDYNIHRKGWREPRVCWEGK